MYFIFQLQQSRYLPGWWINLVAMSPNFIGNLHRFGPRGLWNVHLGQYRPMLKYSQ